MAKIEHVFVLMLENRSFDHLFGFSGLPGVLPPAASFGFRPGAPDKMKKDPPHEYDDVKAQVASGAMTGFANYASTGNMLGLTPESIPVLMSLATDYLLMDNWFSSMPGPTWPNRFFAHAASSGGLDNSPAFNDTLDAEFRPDKSFQIEHGHIFDRLSASGNSWRVYHGDRPQVLALTGMVSTYVGSTFHPKTAPFRPSTNLGDDLANGDAAQYTWIEPTYDPIFSFNGDSQHPLGAISAGEALVKRIYNAVRQSSLWESSVLVVTWDEHGGFFDHVVPPKAQPPGDQPLSYERGSPKGDCKFNAFGPRVPAILISPMLPKGLGSVIFPGQNFDHASIVSSVRSHFGLAAPLTRRDQAAPTWNSALLSAPRVDVGGPLNIRTARVSVARNGPVDLTAVKGPSAANLAGFLHIARGVDIEIAKLTGTPPLTVSTHLKSLDTARLLLAKVDPLPSEATKAHRLQLDYIAAVDELETSLRRKVARSTVAVRKRAGSSSKVKAERKATKQVASPKGRAGRSK